MYMNMNTFTLYINDYVIYQLCMFTASTSNTLESSPFPFPIIFQRGCLLSDSWDRKSALRDNGHRRKQHHQRHSGNLPDMRGGFFVTSDCLGVLMSMCRDGSMMRIQKNHVPIHIYIYMYTYTLYIYIYILGRKETLFDENVRESVQSISCSSNFERKNRNERTCVKPRADHVANQAAYHRGKNEQHHSPERSNMTSEELQFWPFTSYRSVVLTSFMET